MHVLMRAMPCVMTSASAHPEPRPTLIGDATDPSYGPALAQECGCNRTITPGQYCLLETSFLKTKRCKLKLTPPNRDSGELEVIVLSQPRKVRRECLSCMRGMALSISL